jgi:hypothetical protein
MRTDSNKIFKFFLLFLMAYNCFISGAFSQDQPAEQSIVRAFNQYRQQYVPEKLFVHTDRDSYVSREILWFRIYYVDAFYNKPDSISKIAYIEMLDKNNLPVIQQKVSLKAGESNGSMIIPVNIPSGIYRLRAYTSWMKNFSTDYYFEKAVRITRPQNGLADTALSKRKHYDIQFFPEGGNLVQHIESKVAFRITDAYGKGLGFAGILVNATNDTVVKFQPANRGLGNFLFTPAPGQSYKAIIRFPGGEEVVKELPAAYPDGYTLSLSKTNEGQIAVRVNVSSALDGEDVYLFVHGSHSFLPVEKEKTVDRRADFLLNPAGLEGGISHFTLFNKTGRPVCERLYFKYPEKNLFISVKANPGYKTREKIDLGLSLKDSVGNPIYADLSIGVYRLDSLQDLDPSNISDYFYLGSELGAVESQALCFDKVDKSRETDMDNLMLTHGWRRFLWKDLFEHKSTPLEFVPEHYGHIIQGKLVDNNTGLPAVGINTYLSIPSTRNEFRCTTSGTEGHVKFEIPGFYGSQEIILQTNTSEDSTHHVEISNPFSEKYSIHSLPEYVVPVNNSADLLDHSIAEQVQHIYAGPRLSRFSIPAIDTNSFYSDPDEKYYLDNYTRFQTMEEVIREYVVSTNVTHHREKFQLRLVNKPQKKYFEDPPLILIDGVPFFEPDDLFQQDPAKIRRLDLVNREYSLGYQYFSGVISLTTYRGDLNGIRMNPHATVFDYPGIPEQREFFSPVYETEDQVNSRMPDFRTLLYWSPEIKTDQQNGKSIQFYASDIPGKYVAVIMGLTPTGEPCSQVFYFTVKK